VLQGLSASVNTAIRDKSILPPAIILRDYRTGQTLHAQDMRDLAARYGAPMITIHRAHLRQALYDEALRQGVFIRHGVAVRAGGVDLEAGTVRLVVATANGGSPPDEGAEEAETFRADLFIGADGARSIIRSALTGRRETAIPHGKVVSRLLIPEAAIRARADLRHVVEEPNIAVWLGPSCQAVTYGLAGQFNVAVTWPSSTRPEDAFFGAQPVDLDAFRAQLAGWDPTLRELLGLATACSRWMLFEPIVDDDHTPWVDPAARFCIIGDAAHRGLPYLGQGAAAGIETVAVLAHLMGQTSDAAQAHDCLNLYQGLRKERTGHIIRAALKMGRIWQMPDGPAKEERDREFLTETPTAGYPNFLADPFFQQWLWGFDVSKAASDAWEAYRRDKERESITTKDLHHPTASQSIAGMSAC
jgi:salicylate hydroxylase